MLMVLLLRVYRCISGKFLHGQITGIFVVTCCKTNDISSVGSAKLLAYKAGGFFHVLFLFLLLFFGVLFRLLLFLFLRIFFRILFISLFELLNESFLVSLGRHPHMDLNPNGLSIKSRAAYTHFRYKSLQDIGQIQISRKRTVEAAIQQMFPETGIVLHVLHEVFAIYIAVIREGVEEVLFRGFFSHQFEKNSWGQQDGLPIALIKDFIGIIIFYLV